MSDGETVEVYDPDLEQVTIHNLDDRVQSTPALLLSGEVDNLEETYKVSVVRLGITPGNLPSSHEARILCLPP